MMTVRFPTGFCVQYNGANYALRRDAYTDLFTKEGGTWIAQVPNDAIIEVVQPCRTYFVCPDEMLAGIEKDIRLLKRRVTTKRK